MIGRSSIVFAFSAANCSLVWARRRGQLIERESSLCWCSFLHVDRKTHLTRFSFSVCRNFTRGFNWIGTQVAQDYHGQAQGAAQMRFDSGAKNRVPPLTSSLVLLRVWVFLFRRLAHVRSLHWRRSDRAVRVSKRLRRRVCKGGGEVRADAHRQLLSLWPVCRCVLKGTGQSRLRITTFVLSMAVVQCGHGID